MLEIDNKALQEWFNRYPESKQLYDQLSLVQQIEFTLETANTFEFQCIRLRIALAELKRVVKKDIDLLIAWIKG